MDKLHRFDPATGRYVGWIVRDREDYSHRSDLTPIEPPAHQPRVGVFGHGEPRPLVKHPHFINGAWELHDEP